MLASKLWKLSVVAALGSAACLSYSVAQARPANLADAESNYRQERAACLNGLSNQDRATCLREAGAALAEAKRGRLADHQEANYSHNALLRCQRLPMEDREACEHRVNGDGIVSGSVPAGGLYREYHEIIPAPVSASDQTPVTPPMELDTTRQ